MSNLFPTRGANPYERRSSSDGLEILQHKLGVGMIGAEELLEYLQRALVVNPRRRTISHVMEHSTKIVQEVRDSWVVGTIRSFVNLERPFEEGTRADKIPSEFRTYLQIERDLIQKSDALFRRRLQTLGVFYGSLGVRQ